MNICPAYYNTYFKALRKNLGIPDCIVIKLEYLDLTDPEIDDQAGTEENIMTTAYVLDVNPLCYEIVLHDDLGDFEEVEGIAHEFKHIQQMMLGLLVHAAHGTFWNGQALGDLDGYKHDDYSNLPHEIEARIFEAEGLEIADRLGLIIL